LGNWGGFLRPTFQYQLTTY